MHKKICDYDVICMLENPSYNHSSSDYICGHNPDSCEMAKHYDAVLLDQATKPHDPEWCRDGILDREVFQKFPRGES